MRKSLIGIALIAAIVFAAGYVIGQIRGVTTSSAAGSTNGSAPAQLWSGLHFHLDNKGGDRHGPHAGGKVTAVTGNTVTVQPFADRDGQQSQVTAIQLTGSTQYFRGPGQSATKADIKVGTYVHAEGTVSNDGKTLTAASVFIFTSAPGPGMHGGHGAMGPHADGKVTAISGDKVTVQADNEPAGSTEYSKVTTIQLTASTVYDAGPGQTASKSSITVGSYIVARGTLSSDGTTLTATRVMVRPSGAGAWGGHFRSNFRLNPFGGDTGPTV